MRRLIFSLSLFLLLIQSLVAQTGLVSGNLNITSFPTNNGNGTFTVVGTFSDPKGQYFAADVTAGHMLWKGNNYFPIQVASANGSELTLTVKDTFSIGFIATGNAQIGQETGKLKLPGVSTTGDSNPALATPPDHSALFNFILQRIDAGISGVYEGEFVSDTADVTTPVNGDVFIVGDTLLFNNGDQWITYAPGGSGGNAIEQYQASGVNGAVDNGAFVTTSLLGATYERTGGSGQNTEGILTVPAGTILQGLTVHFSSGQAPGNTFYLNVDYSETAKAVNGAQESVMPVSATVTTKPGTFSDAAPATNYVHSGTPLQVGIAQVDDNGSRVRVRYKIQNFNQQAGSNASMLSIVFP